MHLFPCRRQWHRGLAADFVSVNEISYSLQPNIAVTGNTTVLVLAQVSFFSSTAVI